MLSDDIRQLIAESVGSGYFNSLDNTSESDSDSDTIYDRFYIDEDTNIVRYTNFDGEEVYENSLLLEALINEITIDAVKGVDGIFRTTGMVKGAAAAAGGGGGGVLVAGGATMAAPIAGAFKIGAGALALVAAAGAATSTVMDFFRKKGVNEQEARIIADITKSASEKMADMRPESTSFINFMSNMKTVGTGIAGAAGAGADSLTSLTKAAGSAMTGTYNSINNAASSAYNEFVSGASQVADSSKAYILSTADSIKVSVAELEKQREYHNKILNMIERSPTDFKNIVISFFHKYGQNPFIKYLVDISQQNPAVFFALLVAIPVVAIGAALGGVYLVARSIKSQSDAAKALKSRENELINTSDPKRRKQIQNEMGIIGAKALLVTK